MSRFQQFYYSWLLISTLLLPTVATASERHNESNYDRISLTSTAADKIENDILIATLSVRREGANPAKLAEKANETIKWAITEAKKISGIRVQTLAYQTSPIYQQQRLSGWRVRQSLRLESKNMAALSQLIGTLQERLGVEQVSYRISNQRRNAVEEKLIAKAIALFQQRAQLVTEKMASKRYRVVKMNINTGGNIRPRVMRAEISEMAGGRKAPSFEAGSQTVTVSINGTIELQLD